MNFCLSNLGFSYCERGVTKLRDYTYLATDRKDIICSEDRRKESECNGNDLPDIVVTFPTRSSVFPRRVFVSKECV